MRLPDAFVALIAPACLLAACSLASLDELQGGSGGSGPTSGPGGGEAPASTTVGGPVSTTSSGATSGGGDGGDGTAASTGGGQGGSGGDPGPPDLVDTGLLLRYFLDEAPEGTTPTRVADASEPALDLSLDYAEGMEFTTEDGHVGISWQTAGSEGVAESPVAGTELLSLNNSIYGTIEAVFRVEQATTAGSRILHVGTGADSSFTLALSPGAEVPEIAPPTDLELRIRTSSGAYLFTFFEADLGVGRTVVHAVFDTREAEPEDRMRMYQDGVRLEGHVDDDVPGQNEALRIDAGELVTIGNRLIGDRSPQGTIYYAAMYLTAFTDEEIARNVAALTERDDQ